MHPRKESQDSSNPSHKGICSPSGSPFRVYRYGFPFTVSLRALDDDRVVDEVDKLYAVGRLGAHGVAVMQNGVTMYLSGGSGGLFKYEDAGDGSFTSGTLYAARFRAKSRITEITVGTELEIEWIELAETNAEDLATEVSGDIEVEPLRFDDIFDYAEPRSSGCGGNREFIEFGGQADKVTKMSCIECLQTLTSA